MAGSRKRNVIHKNYQKTKIIATIGPSSSSMENLKELIFAGVDICRLNFSHGHYKEHKKVIDAIHEINLEYKTYVGILADLQGPKIRIGDLKDDKLALKEGQTIGLTTDEVLGNEEKITVRYSEFVNDVKPQELVMLDDGNIILKIIKIDTGSNIAYAKVIHAGVLLPHKGVNLPDTKISLPALTEKDKRDIAFIVEEKIQFIGLSFVRSAADIIELKYLIDKISPEKRPNIIAKIEKPEAIKDIDEIIRQSDGIMIARGDLGVEIPLQKVPLLQKKLIKKCLNAAKPVIIATQMMESMVKNIRPTRAEVNDVANGVMDGADALMLSAETSIGKYPIKVVENMVKIIRETENESEIYYKIKKVKTTYNNRFITDSICNSACLLSQQTNAAGIIAMTHSGYTAYYLSSQRPKTNIFVFTDNHALLSKLSLVWGVRGFFYDKYISTDHTIEDIKYFLQKKGFFRPGDLIINISSTPISEKGKTNTVKVSEI